MKRFILTAILILFSGLCFAQGKSAWDTIPPGFDRKIINYIIDQSYENDIDPELVFALISVESEWKFAPPSKNRNGTYDYGLMRLNSAFLDDFIWRYGDPGKKYDLKNNVYDNLQIGIRHFALLYRQCKGNALLALYSYNCGLVRTMEGRVPSSTRDYALAILSVYDPSFSLGTD